MSVERPLSLVPVRVVRRCCNSPLQGGATPFPPSAGCGPLSWSTSVIQRCDSLSLAGSRQRVKSLRSAVWLRLVIITARAILSRRVSHSADAPFHTHLPRTRRSARLFLPCSPFVPHSGTPVTDSPRGNCLCPVTLFVAAVSSLVTQRLSAFRSFLAPAYRLCCVPRLYVESSAPSSRQLLRR